MLASHLCRSGLYSRVGDVFRCKIIHAMPKRCFRKLPSKTKTTVLKNDTPFVDYRALIKPGAFALSVSGFSYLGAAIWQYEHLRAIVQGVKNKTHGVQNYTHYKAGSLRRQLHEWWHTLHPGRKVAASIIALNIAVFAMWRVPALRPVMETYFASSPFSGAPCTSMFLSTFSHFSAIHLFANMYVLWSFAPAVCQYFGREQFLATYLSAGVMSGYLSYIVKILRHSRNPSVGASGAIIALIGVIGILKPDAQFSIAFVSEIYPHSFSASSGIKFLVGLDTVGLLMGWRLLDHAAHLGGMLFGILYTTYGREYIWAKREKAMKIWHEIREKL